MVQDSQLLAVADLHGKVMLWNTKTWDQVRERTGERGKGREGGGERASERESERERARERDRAREGENERVNQVMTRPAETGDRWNTKTWNEVMHFPTEMGD